MPEHKVSKKIGFSYNDPTLGSLTLGTSIEVETSDKDIAENFLQKSIVRDAVKKLKEMLYDKQIEKNTIDTIVIASNKIRALKGEKCLYEIPLKLAVSLLESASLEDGKFLQDRWSSLLANAATKRQKTSISFVYILKELEEVDVKFLYFLFSLYEKDGSFSEIKNAGYTKTLFINSLVLSEEDYESITDNLLRLNLIKTANGATAEGNDDTHIASHHKKGLILFTHLGLSFVRSCIF